MTEHHGDSRPTDKQIEFAREVVALARKYMITDLTMEYRPAFRAKDYSAPQIRVQWSEGRHEDREKIGISYTQTARVDEKAKP